MALAQRPADGSIGIDSVFLYFLQNFFFMISIVMKLKRKKRSHLYICGEDYI